MASKWIPLETPDLPATRFAADVLRLRLDDIQERLPLAAHEYRQDIEHVHALRVSCRRASAALKAFRPLMQGKPRSLVKLLKRLRKAAGPARDTDVMLARIKRKTKKTEDRAQLDFLLARLKRARRRAQKVLLEVEAQTDGRKLERGLKKCLALLPQRHDSPDNQTVEEFARGALRVASREMFQKASQSQPTIGQLHELRIAGKRLRYSIELFSGAFPTALRSDVYPLVEKLQTRLGTLNDHATAQAFYQRWLTKRPTNARVAYLAGRIAAEHDAALAGRRRFLKWWTPKRVATLESRLAELIDGS